MATMVGTPRVVFHLEAETEECICPKLSGCGGINDFSVYCPEHGIDGGPQGRFHTHAQQVDRVSRGRWVL